MSAENRVRALLKGKMDESKIANYCYNAVALNNPPHKVVFDYASRLYPEHTQEFYTEFSSYEIRELTWKLILTHGREINYRPLIARGEKMIQRYHPGFKIKLWNVGGIIDRNIKELSKVIPIDVIKYYIFEAPLTCPETTGVSVAIAPNKHIRKYDNDFLDSEAIKFAQLNEDEKGKALEKMMKSVDPYSIISRVPKE